LISRADRPALPDVTLVAVTSVALGPTLAALEQSMLQARFAKVLLLSDRRPAEVVHPLIEWRRISPLRSRLDYSRFMLRELGSHVATSHALCIQWDGYVLRGQAWHPAFLAYDYIGAVWPHFSDGHNVGNGGFSLRSRHLLEACRQLPFDGESAEDVVIGRLCRDRLEAQGLKFAPEAVARSFAYERASPTGDEFGFHGAFNLVHYVAPEAADRLFAKLEDGMLAPNERWQLLRWAVSQRRFKLARNMLARIF
jgi:hypothetical protein